MVQVKVGPDKTIFSFHKDLLCNAAAYFRAALDGKFREAEEKSIEMPEDNPEIFNYFQFWIYGGSILETHETEKDIDDSILVKLWVFAEARGIFELQNAAMTLLIARIDSLRRTPTEQISYIYEHTSEKSALRRMVVDVSAYRGELSSWFETSERSKFPIDFLFELITKLHSLKKGVPLRSGFVPADYQV